MSSLVEDGYRTIQEMAKDYGVTWKTARNWLRREQGLCTECAQPSETRMCKRCHAAWYPAWKKCRDKRDRKRGA